MPIAQAPVDVPVEALLSVEPEPEPEPEAAPAPRAPVVDVQADLVRVLEVVARMCDHVIEYLEADRKERVLMVETLGHLARAVGANNGTAAATPVTPAREHVIGGSVDAGPEPVVDLTVAEHQPTRVEVRCRFGQNDHWVDGFDVIETVGTADGPQFRLRRQRDGAVLPQLFDAASIRHVETFQELDHTPRGWSAV
jgi:hypothetical protein